MFLFNAHFIHIRHSWTHRFHLTAKVGLVHSGTWTADLWVEGQWSTIIPSSLPLNSYPGIMDLLRCLCNPGYACLISLSTQLWCLWGRFSGFSRFSHSAILVASGFDFCWNIYNNAMLHVIEMVHFNCRHDGSTHEGAKWGWDRPVQEGVKTYFGENHVSILS